MSDFEIRKEYSARRKKTVQAKFDGDTIVLKFPQGISPAEEQRHIDALVPRLLAKREKKALVDASDYLHTRAEYLNETYLEGQATWQEIRWVTNQTRRWGSCNQRTGVIRMSHHLRKVPQYVLDSVLIHELAHTFVTGGHNAEFWSWASRAPQFEKARGFLDGYATGLNLA